MRREKPRETDWNQHQDSELGVSDPQSSLVRDGLVTAEAAQRDYGLEISSDYDS